MTSNWSYQVKHIDDATGTITDITTYVRSIPVFSDVGSGQVNYATLVLNALNGRFLLDTVSTQPFLDQFDKITIRVTDINGNQYGKVFEINGITPIEDSGNGTGVQLDLIGIERALQDINYSGDHRFRNAFWVAGDIADTYSENKGTKQPTLVGTTTIYNPTTRIGNGLPTYTVNTYPYGDSEGSCYERLVDITDKLGGSVDAGGVRDFYEVNFTHDISTPTTLGLAIFSSGTHPEITGGTPAVIDGSQSNINLGETEGGIMSQTGSRVLGWGDGKKGSLPNEFAKFDSADEAWFYRPNWVSGITYTVDSKVQYGRDSSGKPLQYRCIVQHTSSSGNAPPSANWTQITQASEYGNVYQYSRWTDDKAAVWRNCGCDIYNAGVGRGFMDSNMVVWTDTFMRTWANDTVTSASSADTAEQFESLEYPRGYRILIRGTAPAFIGSTDVSGVPTTNSVVEMVHYEIGSTFTRGWKVKYKFPVATQIGMQVVVIKTAKTYSWSGASFTDISSNTLANDCFHPYASLTNVEGVDPRPADQGWTTNIDSAIKVTYTFPQLDIASASGIYKVGAWLSMQFPFPSNKTGLGSQYVGTLYGPNNPTSGIGSGIHQEPATLDIRNMTYTHSGKRGFNNDESEDLGPINAIAFYMKIESTLGMFGALAANIPIRCTIYDTNDNVAVQDFVVPFRDNWASIELPINGFKTYSANKPLYPTEIGVTFTPPKELPTDRILETWNIKFITWQIQAFYDEDGRYYPGQHGLLNGDATALQTIPGGSISMYLDGFRFVKPLLQQSNTDTTRNIEGNFSQKPYIGNRFQLQSDLKSDLEIEQFRHKEFDVRTTGRCDIKFGDSFYYRNARLVNDADNGANTVKLVAKKLEHSITKPAAGSGGFTTRIIGVKRFT